METIYFVLGMISVLLVLGVVVVVKVSLSVKELQKKVNEMEYLIEGNFDDTHRRIDDEMRDIQSQLDSRLDKLENKLTTKK